MHSVNGTCIKSDMFMQQTPVVIGRK